MGGRLIDVGCDHGLLSVSLLLSNKVQHAFAVDINASPLEKARQLARDYAIEPVRFEAILSDGLSSFASLKGASVVIAGMGGGRISKIIGHASMAVQDASKLILQPNTDAMMVRRRLDEFKMTIIDEALCQEKRKHYVIIVAKHLSAHKPLTEREMFLGPVLMKRQCHLFKAQCRDTAHFLMDLKLKLGPAFPEDKSLRLQWVKPFAY